MFNQLTRDPAVSVALMDAAIKHPAIAASKDHKQVVMEQRAILAAALDAKKGLVTAKTGEIERCAADLIACSARGWDLIIDGVIDIITR